MKCSSILIILFSLKTTFFAKALKPSKSCGNELPLQPRPGRHHRFEVTYGDIGLGEVERSYIIQIPASFDNTEPVPMVMDLHGYNSNAQEQIQRSHWQTVALQNNFVLVWPNGPGDSPNSIGSWNVSKTFGPEGACCDIHRDRWGEFECHYSCPLCDSSFSCDWSSCYDDLGFMEFLISHIGEKWCLDMDQLHLSGYSNGGMFAYYAASNIFDGMGFATFNPVAASPLLGFGTPSANNGPINFSILDMHGFNDDIIPYNEESVWCYGLGPRGTLISRDGYYYEDKISYVQIWSVFMNCDENEEPYVTDYDGQNEFRCFERKCGSNDGDKTTSFVRCIGDQTHDYPFSGTSAAAEVAWAFMKMHPRN